MVRVSTFGDCFSSHARLVSTDSAIVHPLLTKVAHAALLSDSVS